MEVTTMVEVTGEIVIDRPVDEVFDFVANEENEPRYNPHMRLAEKISEGATGSATRFRTELRTMGRTMPMIVEFTAYERPRRLASVTRSSMMQTEGALTFDPVAGGTRMRWSWDLEPHGVLRFVGPIVAGMGRRQERRIWTSMKHLLEAGPQ
jgi:uncharacterized protein YndB with AHSA1/START domain